MNPFILKILGHMLLAPFYCFYGLFALSRAIFRFAKGAHRAGMAMGNTIYCPNGHANPVTGRFECGSCHAVYHGWIGRCPMCGTGASWTSCQTCQVSVRLPWES